MSNPLTTFVYDAARDGYDTSLWKALTGTPSASSSKLRFTSAAAVYERDTTKGEATFILTIPTAPTTGDDRRWGFYSAATGSFVGFKIHDTAFTATVGATNSTVAWSTDWSNAAITYKVIWEAGLAKFYISGVCVATISTSIPAGPLSLYVENQEADNMDLTSVTVATRS